MLVIFCFVCTWMLIIVGCWSFWDACKEGIATLKRLHEIPCANCEFFTGDYRLKCTVHPREALSEEAIGCLDYQPPQYLNRVTCSGCQKLTFSQELNQEAIVSVVEEIEMSNIGVR